MDEIKVNGTDQNYLDQIETLKKKMESMVEGDEYNKVLAEHKKLTNDYINKRQPVKSIEAVTLSAKELTRELNRKDLTKVEHIKLSLDYRDAVKSETGKDVWVGAGITEQDAQKVEEHYRGLLEEYGDNPSEFTYRFDQSLVDDPDVMMALRARKNKK